MFKKIGALAMVSVLSIGMVACSGGKKDDKKEDNIAPQKEPAKTVETK
ncbi:hypothetical protein [Bacillus toyonensis]|nr:hypothetical protein [Bacillus toyonensis]